MKKLRILIVDGQGGGIGRQLTENIRTNFPEMLITAVGTNVMATQAMMKAGADEAATGENAVIVACRKADIIAGPLGIVIADALYGEITPRIAAAIGQSSAVRFLIPLNQCGNIAVGVENLSTSYLIHCCVDQIRKYIDNSE